MKYPPFYEKFLTRLGELMATDFSTQAIVDKVNTRIGELMPEMEQHTSSWDARIRQWLNEGTDTLPAKSLEKMVKDEVFSMKKWKNDLNSFIKYAEERPLKLIQYFMDDGYDHSMNLSEEQVKKYFSDAIQVIYDYKESKK